MPVQAAAYSTFGLDHGLRLFAQPACHYAPEVYGGIRESGAAEMLREFVRDRRGR